MNNLDSVRNLKKVIYELSKVNNVITLSQIIEASGVKDPREDIETLVKGGIIIKLSPEEFKWV